jgi:hypothetical protein
MKSTLLCLTLLIMTNAVAAREAQSTRKDGRFAEARQNARLANEEF